MNKRLLAVVSLMSFLLLSACGGGGSGGNPEPGTPTVTAIDQQYVLNTGSLSFEIEATDPDGQSLDYDVLAIYDSNGNEMSFLNDISIDITNNVVTVTWTTNTVPSGDYEVEIRITSTAGGTQTIRVPVTVRTALTIGYPGPAGGIVFYTTNGGLNGLEAAPVDQSTAAVWGCDGTSIAGATGTAIGTGTANTAAIVVGCVGAEVTAAEMANAYALNGYTDWYLPSKDELNQLYWKKDVVGGFASDFYWSSSQNGSGNAWVQDFVIGLQPDFNKIDPLRVRAVRAF